jgi:hypothetical protein
LTAARACLPRGLCTPKNCRYCLENSYIKRTTLHGSIQDSIVGVVTRLQAGHSRVWFMAGTSKFLLLWYVQAACGAIPGSDSFLWKLSSQDVKLTIDCWGYKQVVLCLCFHYSLYIPEDLIPVTTDTSLVCELKVKVK